MGFSEILGHQKQMEILCSALANGRLHHAYLFVGPEGIGKRTVALSLAKAIHCGESNNDFCGQCANCARIQAGNHPDVRLIEPLPGKKEIGIQQIRDIEKELNFRSFSGHRKVAIIDPATLMNLSGQNALLKTLEEPPQDCLLILIACNAGGLLPTLRSRCLRLSFGSLPRDVLSRFLVCSKGMNPEEADVLAAMAMGSVGAADRIDGEELRSRRRSWIALLASLDGGDYRSATDAAEALGGSRDESLQFLQWAETWYRDMLVHAVTRASEDLINRDMLAQIQEHSADGDMERILSAIAETVEATRSIQRNLNRRMVLEQLFFNFVKER